MIALIALGRSELLTLGPGDALSSVLARANNLARISFSDEKVFPVRTSWTEWGD
jgi:hypothetical protein